MPSGKRRRFFTLVDTNPTFVQKMLLGLEMADQVDQSFVKVHFHRMTTEYSNWLVDKIANKEAEDKMTFLFLALNTFIFLCLGII